MYEAVEGFSEVIDELERILSGKVETPQWTLTGELITNPYPVLKDRGRVIRGIPIREENFHELKVRSHDHRVLAVDASLKVLFDCGSFKIVISKISCSIWCGRYRVFDFKPKLKIELVKSRLEAMEFLFNSELEAVRSASSKLGPGDYCILDRALMAIPAYKESTRKMLDRLCDYLSFRGIRLIGITKSSQLEVNTGENLLGHLLHRSRDFIGDRAWYYYPIFRSSQYPKWYLGVITVVRFSADSDHVFRVDINRRDVNGIDVIDEYLSEVAYLQDPAIPGYPYPPKSCHDEAKIGRQELMCLKLSFLESLSRETRRRFIANLKSTSFKEEELWAK